MPHGSVVPGSLSAPFNNLASRRRHRGKNSAPRQTLPHSFMPPIQADFDERIAESDHGGRGQLAGIQKTTLVVTRVAKTLQLMPLTTLRRCVSRDHSLVRRPKGHAFVLERQGPRTRRTVDTVVHALRMRRSAPLTMSRRTSKRRNLVEGRGLEPPTPTLRTLCSPN